MQIDKEGIVEFFKDVSFIENTHTYFVKNKSLSTSVSGVLEAFKKKVNFEEIALKKDKELGLPEGSHSTIWKLNSELACAKGNKAHFFGELYAFNRNLKPTDGFERAIKKFWDELPDFIVPLFTELVMYHKTCMFGGTADIICLDTRSGDLVILDYKTNKELFNQFKENTLEVPFSFLPDSNFSKYELQFSLYQILLEQYPGIKVGSRKLIWIKDSGDYQLLDCTDYTQHLKKYLNDNY